MPRKKQQTTVEEVQPQPQISEQKHYTWGSHGKHAHIWEYIEFPPDEVGQKAPEWRSLCNLLFGADGFTPDGSQQKPCKDCIIALPVTAYTISSDARKVYIPPAPPVDGAGIGLAYARSGLPAEQAAEQAAEELLDILDEGHPNPEGVMETYVEFVDETVTLQEPEQPEQPVQAELIPQGPPPEPLFAELTLDALPPNTELVGEAPDAQFIASVRKYGVLQPLMLVLTADSYKVVDGRRRLKAARIAGVPTVAALVYPDDWTVEQVLSIVSNEQRSDNVGNDLRNIVELLEKGYGPDEIREAVGLTKGEWGARTKLLGLIEAFRQLLYEGLLRSSLAVQICVMSKADQEKLLETYFANGKLTAEDVRNIRSAGKLEATSMFDDDMFNTPGPPEAREWDEVARDLVEQLEAIVPQRYYKLHETITTLLNLLSMTDERIRHANAPEPTQEDPAAAVPE
jgi:ParB-like chromosome segregation protein Spo0J